MSCLSADSWLPLPNFLQTCCPRSWPSMWPPQDHSDNERKYDHQLRKAGGSGLQLQVLPPTPRLPDWSPSPLCSQSSMFPVSLRMPLEMAPYGVWGMLAAFLSLLCCRGSGEKAFEGPEQLMVGSGEFQFINCTASCTDPKRIVLETALNKTLLESHAQWKLFKVYNVSKDEELLCSSTCGGKQETKLFHITVFYPPKQVLLTLSPTSVAVGTLFTIECRVPAVAPLECLIVTLLRGTDILCNQTFVGTALSPQDAVVTHNTTAHREDGLYNFSCEALMDLRSRGGGLVHSVSDPQRLEVKEPEPKLQVVIIAVVIALLLLFVTFVLLCFAFGQKWFRGRTGHYRVHATWRRLIGSHRAAPV